MGSLRDTSKGIQPKSLRYTSKGIQPKYCGLGRILWGRICTQRSKLVLVKGTVLLECNQVAWVKSSKWVVARECWSHHVDGIASSMASKIARMIQGCHGHGDEDPICKGHLKEAAHLAVSLQQLGLVAAPSEKVRLSSVRAATRLASCRFR